MLANDTFLIFKRKLLFPNAWVPFGEQDNSAIYAKFDFSWALISYLFLGKANCDDHSFLVGINTCFRHFLFYLTWSTISHGTRRGQLVGKVNFINLFSAVPEKKSKHNGEILPSVKNYPLCLFHISQTQKLMAS